MRYMWTQTSRDTAQQLLQTLQEATKRLMVVFFTGFSGVGKSAFLEGFFDIRKFQGLEVVGPSQLDGIKRLDHSLFVEIGLNQLPEYKVLLLKQGIEVRTVILKGWSALEVRSMIPANINLNLSSLKPEEFIELSLGSTLLMLTYEQSGMSYQQAVDLTIEYLVEQLIAAGAVRGRWGQYTTADFEAMAAPYLQTPIPEVILKGLLERDPQGHRFRRHIYSDVLYVLQNLKTLQSQPAPFFLAPESETVLDEMLQVFDPHAAQWYDALVMNVPPHLLEEFVQLFREDTPRCWGGNGRLGAFGSRHRKVRLTVRNSAEVIYFYETETQQYRCEESERKLGDAARKLAIPAEGGSIYVHQHDHLGGPGFCNIPGFVWAFESWAQQHGLHYITDNKNLDRIYRYNPTKKQIEFLTPDVTK